MKKKRVLFSGYYGLGNAGDEAVLAASVQIFRERRPDLALGALSATPAVTRRELQLDTSPRMQPAAVLAAIRRATLFLSGGGSLLQDRTSLKSLMYYLLLLDLARRAGVRTMVFAQGIGPLIRPSARRWTQRVLSRVDAITVRDADSKELLREIGVEGASAPEIEVTADPVFALAPHVTDRVTACAPERPSIAVALRPWEGVERILDPLAEALECYEGRANVLAWPLFPAEDTPVCEALGERLRWVKVLQEPLEPGEWMALAGWTDVVLSMRLHALIFGAARAVPVLGISYDPKIDALLTRLRGRAVGTADSLEASKVRAGIEAALNDTEERRRDREARADHLANLARRNVDAALELLK
jgi:polysaccharide pyruvyl transferase CsaB